MSANAIKPVASLDGSLLARKGHAQPAVSATPFNNPQLAWEHPTDTHLPPARPQTADIAIQKKAGAAIESKAETVTRDKVSTAAEDGPGVAPPVVRTQPVQTAAPRPAAHPTAPASSTPRPGVDQRSNERTPPAPRTTSQPQINPPQKRLPVGLHTAPTSASNPSASPQKVAPVGNRGAHVLMGVKMQEADYLRLKYQAQQENCSGPELIRRAIDALLDEADAPKPERWNVAPD